MKIQLHNGMMRITELRELCTANARAFGDEASAALDQSLATIELDLSQVQFVDSGGLGALVSLHKEANRRTQTGGVSIRLLDPPASVQQVLELTRMHSLFEIVQRSSPSIEDSSPTRP
jgi:anti-sigma B factor antagonist